MKHCCLGLSMLHLIILLANVTWSNSLQPSVSSVQFSGSVVSDSLRPHGLQHARPPCPSPTPRACSNSCPLCWWCHPTISSSVVPFSSIFPSTRLFSNESALQIRWPKYWMEFQLQHQSFQWISRTDFLWDGLVGSPCGPRDNKRVQMSKWQVIHRHPLFHSY